MELSSNYRGTLGNLSRLRTSHTAHATNINETSSQDESNSQKGRWKAAVARQPKDLYLPLGLVTAMLVGKRGRAFKSTATVRHADGSLVVAKVPRDIYNA